MADEKTLKTAEKTETKPAASKPAAKKAAPAKKAAAKKAAPKKAPAKPAAKKAKTAPEAELSPLDILTTAVWKNIEKKSVDNIPFAIAIQVNVHDAGTFYIAVKANPDEDKQVMQSDYYLADGIVETGADEIKKIAAGNYDYIAAAKSGAFIYRGDLSKGIFIAELLK